MLRMHTETRPLIIPLSTNGHSLLRFTLGFESSLLKYIFGDEMEHDLSSLSIIRLRVESVVFLTSTVLIGKCCTSGSQLITQLCRFLSSFFLCSTHSQHMAGSSSSLSMVFKVSHEHKKAKREKEGR